MTINNLIIISEREIVGTGINCTFEGAVARKGDAELQFHLILNRFVAYQCAKLINYGLERGPIVVFHYEKSKLNIVGYFHSCIRSEKCLQHERAVARYRADTDNTLGRFGPFNNCFHA